MKNDWIRSFLIKEAGQTSTKIEVTSVPGKDQGVIVTSPISKGELIFTTEATDISDADWEKIKGSDLEKLYGLRWGDSHKIFLGDIPKDLIQTLENERAANASIFEGKGIRLHIFNFLNSPTEGKETANVSETFTQNGVEVTALRDIKPGEELIKGTPWTPGEPMETQKLSSLDLSSTSNPKIQIIPLSQWQRGKDDPTEYDSENDTIRVREDYNTSSDPAGWMVHEYEHAKMGPQSFSSYPNNPVEEKAYKAQFMYLKNKGYKSLNDVMKIPEFAAENKTGFISIFEKWWNEV